jgi:hypothetical protein
VRGLFRSAASGYLAPLLRAIFFLLFSCRSESSNISLVVLDQHANLNFLSVSSINFLLFYAMPVSLPTVLISFSFLIDLKEMPIDEYSKQLLPESKST